MGTEIQTVKNQMTLKNWAEKWKSLLSSAEKTGCFTPRQKELMPVRLPIRLSTQHKQTVLMSKNI